MDKETTFRDAIRDHGDKLYRICCCHVLDPEERKDAYQETLIHIWKGLDGFREGARISSWAYRIAVNTCLDHLRKTGRRKRLLGTPVAADEGDPLEGIPADPPPARDDRIGTLYACIEKLPPVERTVISLYVEDLPGAEIAEITGLSEVNVRARVHRAKARLKSLMNGENDGDR
jgi:RNA polymerase sigma factor (sigma-70 family)